MKKIKVLIVDDSLSIRTLLKGMLEGAPDIEVVDMAEDPFDAREKIKRHNPHVVTLDIEMPKMDGLSFLEKIMTLRPLPVIMISTLTQKGADATLRALELGAVDYISKPVNVQDTVALSLLKDELIGKVRTAVQANLWARDRDEAVIPTLAFRPPAPPGFVIGMGASTGGVETLRDIFRALPANAPPIVVVQHMPQKFTAALAARLDSVSQVQVLEAREGMQLAPGHAYLAPGGRHLKVERTGSSLTCMLEDGAEVSGHRPSIDVMLYSLSRAMGDRAVGVLLTGMGKDGAMGMLRIRESGGYTIGQDESSCVVYGMPKVAYALGALNVQLPLPGIAGHMLGYCGQEGRQADAV